MTSLTEHFDHLRRAFSSSGAGWMLDLIVDSDCFSSLEARATGGDASAKWFVGKLSESLQSVAGPDDEDKLGAFIDRYGEALVYWRLSERELFVERVRESRDVKSPDFLAVTRSGQVFLEIKTPRIVANDPDLPAGMTAHGAMLETALQARCKLEDLAGTKGVHFVEQTIDPYRPSLNMESISGQRMLLAKRINIIISKLESVIKPQQFAAGPTILFVPMLRLFLDLRHPSSLVPFYFDQLSESVVSGQWWHVGWGQPGDLMLGVPDFDGATNLEGRLERLGIMEQQPRLAGLGFVHRCLPDGYFLGILYRNLHSEAPGASSEVNMEAIAAELGDAINDPRNECGWKYRIHRESVRADS